MRVNGFEQPAGALLLSGRMPMGPGAALLGSTASLGPTLSAPCPVMGEGRSAVHGRKPIVLVLSSS